MTAGQWEPFVGAAEEALLDSNHNGIQCYDPMSITETARAVLATVAPLIAEDTRERMVAAAGAALERDKADLVHLRCPYCGGEIDIEVEPTPGYYGESIIDHIECQTYECGATWDRSGVALLKPRKLCGTCETSQRTADDLGGKVPSHDKIWGGRCPGDAA